MNLIREGPATRRVSPVSGGMQDPLAEQGKARPTVHEPFQALQSIDLPLRLPLTNLHRQGKIHRLSITSEATGKSEQFEQPTVLGLHQPRFQRQGLPLPHQRQEARGECLGVSNLWTGGQHRRQVRLFGGVSFLCRLEQEPARLTRRGQVARQGGFGLRRRARSPTGFARPGPPAPQIGAQSRLRSGVPLGPQFAPEGRRIMFAGIPPSAQIGLVGRNLVETRARCLFRKGLCLCKPTDRRPRQAQRARDLSESHPLLGTGPHGFVAFQTTGPSFQLLPLGAGEVP